VLAAALENGGDYSSAIRDTGIDAHWYTHGNHDRSEVLPWDHLDALIDKDYLWDENEKAAKGETTAPCVVGACKACGACVVLNANS